MLVAIVGKLASICEMVNGAEHMTIKERDRRDRTMLPMLSLGGFFFALVQCSPPAISRQTNYVGDLPARRRCSMSR
jgi:hypothetical protein